MKTKYLFAAAAFSLLLSSCSKEDMFCDSEAAMRDGMLKIRSVEQIGFQPDPSTRAAYSGDYSVIFAESDRLGLILLNADGGWIGHYPFIYTSGEWVNSDLEYSADIKKVIAYFPYNEQLQNTVTTVEALKESVDIKTDQSLQTDFEAMDLLVCEIDNVADENLDITFTHAFSLFSLSASSSVTVEDETFEFRVGMEEVSLTIGENTYIPYQTGGANLWIFKDGTELRQDDFKYAYAETGGEKYTKTVSSALTAVAGTRYVLPVSQGDYTALSEGAFYCTSDNTGRIFIIPAGVAVLPEGLTCHGIVFHVMDDEEFGNFATINDLTAEGYPGYDGHALVISLTAGLGFGMSNDDAGLVKSALAEVLNTKDVANGYKITQILKGKAAEAGSGITFNALNNHTERAPGNVTEWYAPSFHELKYMLRGIDPEAITGEGRVFINSQLNKVCDLQLTGNIPSVTYIDNNGTGFCLIKEDGSEEGWHGIPGSEVYYPIFAF